MRPKGEKFKIRQRGVVMQREGDLRELAIQTQRCQVFNFFDHYINSLGLKLELSSEGMWSPYRPGLRKSRFLLRHATVRSVAWRDNNWLRGRIERLKNSPLRGDALTDPYWNWIVRTPSNHSYPLKTTCLHAKQNHSSRQSHFVASFNLQAHFLNSWSPWKLWVWESHQRTGCARNAMEKHPYYFQAPRTQATVLDLRSWRD